MPRFWRMHILHTIGWQRQNPGYTNHRRFSLLCSPCPGGSATQLWQQKCAPCDDLTAALLSRSSKWVHPEGCCLIRNIRYCDEATGLTVRGLNSGRSKRYFSSPKSPGRLWYPPSCLFNCYPASSLGVNCEVNHSPPSSAEVANVWSYTCMPPICLRDGDDENFTFLLLIENRI